MADLRSSRRLSGLIVLLIVILGVLAAGPLSAQESTPVSGSPITFTGTISQVNGSIIVINNLNVSIEGLALDFTPQPGQTVSVTGLLMPDGIIIAQVVVIVIIDGNPTPEAPPEPTPEVTPEATPDVDDDDDVIIVVEGPVQQININIITIYNINIIIDDDDPILTVVQIGDIVRVEGVIDGDDIVLIGGDVQITIIAITIIIVDVDIEINIDTGDVWRDDGSCANPPPPWAPANGWRRRCEGGGGTITIIIGGDGMGMGDDGMGMGDDDDD